jgi:hypothetical protein
MHTAACCGQSQEGQEYKWGQGPRAASFWKLEQPSQSVREQGDFE